MFLTARDVEKLIRNGQPIPDGARLTPGAQDYLRDHGKSPFTARPPFASGNPHSAIHNPQSAIHNPQSAFRIPHSVPTVPDYEYKWPPGADPKTPEAIATFFDSPPIAAIKHRMVDIGRRMWERNYTDGNGGNLTVRVGDNLVLCTPTLISKGFMKPEDICLVDMEGRQLAGARKRTSEVMTHIAIMKRQPLCKSCCHAHPPHATAFAVAKVQPPTCLIPEADIFLGKIALAKYETPGTPEMADTVGEVGKDIEDAYWKMENADSYCHTVWVASQLGGELGSGVGGAKARDFIKIRKALGMPENREALKECELCDNSEFRPGVVCQIPDAAPADPVVNPEIEALVQRLTGEIMKQLGAK